MDYSVILIGNAGLGSGDPKLGGLLLANFLRLLGERGERPEYIILWNEGVKAAEEGSDWVEYLRRLEEQGVKIISCRTCVEFLNIADRIGVGEIGNMPQIQDILFSGRVLTI